VYLTFDDGPELSSTSAVLEILSKHQAKATFFLIAQRAREYRALVDHILREGHAIGDHSLDHRFRNYFRGYVRVRRWLEAGQTEWRDLGLDSQLVGFRPPAGMCTPPLLRAVNDLHWPVILWQKRFFDTVIPWSATRAVKSVAHLRGGEIILLHDRQAPQRVARFCRTLDQYLRAIQERGFELHALPKIPGGHRS
jgi:peptidoglycan/xylan/chitin deacetylase (PgdA/CDA1 family)